MPAAHSTPHSASTPNVAMQPGFPSTHAAHAIAQVHAQFSYWRIDLSEHAMGLEAHHASLFNANVAVSQSKNKIADMEQKVIVFRNSHVSEATPSQAN